VLGPFPVEIYSRLLVLGWNLCCLMFAFLVFLAEFVNLLVMPMAFGVGLLLVSCRTGLELVV